MAESDHESLNSILEALTERGIRFQPGATRSELEDLLRSSTVTEATPLNGILEELDRRKIAYAPSAT
eukprot:CAMPEP_0194064228 /NCGR_PEP_ID=MMETSP0009_2-20130614/82457_1 /TAXON_ID=210454 /ORGANISM="Grammatophora oceanica, Strain CCMP 410" /LENGTH=66 /DNA_ID=CAMNT_0038716637 /DNA_START=86 /DNA_END=282 /DNA_ORIENTATION=+